MRRVPGRGTGEPSWEVESCLELLKKNGLNMLPNKVLVVIGMLLAILVPQLVTAQNSN